MDTAPVGNLRTLLLHSFVLPALLHFPLYFYFVLLFPFHQLPALLGCSLIPVFLRVVIFFALHGIETLTWDCTLIGIGR